MTVLVTGAGGMLGSQIVALLAAEGRAVRAMVRPGREHEFLRQSGVELVQADLEDEASVRKACRGARAIVHCAARLGYWSRGNVVQRQVNVEGTARLLRASGEYSIERFVHVSTIAAVGATRTPLALDESAAWNLAPLRLNYATTKHEAEERARAAAWAGMPVTIVNPGAILGPRCNGKPPGSMIERLRRGEVRWIPGGGTSVCDVEDVARATLAALERGKIGERYLLGGHNLAWSQLYARIATLLGVPAPRGHVPDAAARALALGAGALDLVGLARPPWTPEIFRIWGWYTFADSSRAERELGYTIRPLDETLRRSI